MHEEEQKAIEEIVALREKRLALDEKRHALRMKQLHPWGVGLCAVAVFALCGMSVLIGAGEFGSRKFGDFNSIIAASKCYPKDKAHTATQTVSNAVSVATGNVSSATNSALPTTTSAVITTTLTPDSDRGCPHTWLPVIALILKGLFVLVGLGVAAFTAKTLVSRTDDE